MKAATIAGILILLSGALAWAEPPDAERLRATWKVLSAKVTAGLEGNVDVPEYVGSVWTFDAASLTIRQGKSEHKLAYRLDPSKSPKRMDLGRDLAGRGENSPSLAIYEFKGDRLTVCYTVFNDRPTNFSMAEGIAAVKRLIILEREKK